MSPQSLLSDHAQVRLKQRGISSYVVTLLEQCGSLIRCCGADRLIFDNEAKRRLKRFLDGDRNLRIIEPWIDVYAVISDKDGLIITVARQQGHIRRH